MTALQLSIFDDMEIEPTIAMRRGDAYLTQCANCGTLIAVPGPPKRTEIGPCPICSCTTWWHQDTDHVGPFTKARSARSSRTYGPGDESDVYLDPVRPA